MTFEGHEIAKEFTFMLSDMLDFLVLHSADEA